MKYTKTMNKIIKLKNRNRKIRSILNYMAAYGVENYRSLDAKSYYQDWCKEQFEQEMADTGNRILYLRVRMTQNKKGKHQ